MKPHLRMLLAFLSILGAQQVAAQTYCTPSQFGFNGCWTGEDIDGVTIGTFSDLGTGCGQPRYQDRTTVGTIPLTVGATTSFTITSNAGAGLFFGIWIDANGDGDFNDPNEFVWNGLTAGLSSGTFVVPAGAGSRRLRILAMSKASPLVLTDQCAVSFWGEMQDYTCLLGSASCPTPSALSVISLTDTSATLMWTGTGTKYRIEYGPAGFTQGNGTLDSTITTSLPINGLLALTSYDFYVRNVCSGTNQSGWNGPFTFKTRCETINSYPYVESFENSPWVGNQGLQGNADVFSPCWLRDPSIYNFNTMFVVRQDAVTSPNTGPSTPYGASSGKFLHFYNSFNTGAIATVELPVLNLSSLATPTLTFYFHMFGSGMGKLYVEASTNGGVTWVKLDSIVGQQQTTKAAAWLPLSVNLQSVKTNTTQLRFRALANTTNGDICIDQVSIANAPACPNPQGISITNVLGTGATLNWNMVTGNTYYIEYGQLGFTQGTGAQIDTVTNVGSHAITGLTGEKYYDVYLKSRCSSTDSSAWVGPLTFRTHAVPDWVDTLAPFLPDTRWMKAQGTLANPTSFTLTTNSNWVADGYLNIGTTGAARVGVYSSGTREDWFITKPTDLGSGIPYELHFDAGITAVGGTAPATMAPDDKLRVVISTDNGATWNLSNVIFDITPTTGINNLGSTYIVPLTGYSGVIKVGFYMSRPLQSALQYDFFIDNVGIRAPLPCPAPTAVSTTAITATTIALGWNGGSGPGTYTIEYGPAGFIQGTGTVVSGLTNTTYTAIGLNPVTKYDFYFKKQCDTANASALVGPITLRTGCPPIFSTPYSTNFDDEVNGYPPLGAFLNCWTAVQNTQTYHWRAQTTSNQTNTGPMYDNTQGALGAGKYVVADALYTGSDAVLLAGPFDLDTLSQPMLQFYYHMFGGDMGTLHVDVSTDGSSWQNDLYRLSGQQQTQKTDPWNEVKLALVNYIGDTIYLRFRAERGSSSESNIALDDVSILNATGCVAPAAIQLASATTTTATITWATYQSATSVEYGLAGYWQGNTQIGRVHNVSNTVTLTNLLPGTQYDVYVRDTCNPTIWVGPFTFSTACTAALNGTYTIGGTAGPTNFISFQDALNALNYCGVSGPVTLQLTGGKHLGYFNLGNIPGTSAINNVTFTGTLGADSLVGTTFQYLLQLSGTNHVSFKKITFVAQNDEYLIWMRNQTNHIEFDSCEFVGTQTNMFSSVLIAASANLTNANSPGKNAGDIWVSNSTFRNGYYGLYAIGDVNERASTFVLSNNTFINQYNNAVYFKDIDTLVVDGNTISNQTGNSFGHSLYLQNVAHANINANAINTISNGITLVNSTSTAVPNVVSNNMIIAGDNHIAVNNCNSAQVYHNTTGGTGVGVYLAGTNNNITLLNNIFHSQLNVAFRSVQQIPNLTLDNNIYYRANAGTLAEYIGNHADLAAWKTAQPTLNVNSLQGNVNFVSNSDLHVIGQLANNVGLNLANITSDFDGETRPMAPSTIVDIGADEFTPKVLDATVTAFYEPIFNCGNTSTSVSVVVRNLGSATISTLPVTVLATGGLTATLSSNFSVSLPFGAIDTLLVGTLNTANLTAPVTLTAFAQLSNDEDNGNDTLVRQLYFIPTQPQPLPAAVVCPTATTDTLFATPLPGVTYGWFASQSATTPVDTGNAFGYNPMLQTDWYLGYAPLALDVLSTSTNLANNYNGGVMFNIQAKKNIAIDSISVVSGYPMGTNFLFEVYYIANSLVSGNEQDPNPWILHETITATSTGIPQRLALTTPLTIAAGTHYAMYLAYPCYAVPVTTTTPQVFSNSSLIITPGNALLSKFNYTIPNKQFSGSIYTHEIECSTTRTLVQTQFNPDTAFASFTTQVSQPNKVDVNASASNGQLVNWLFGDGGSATGAIATHIYTTGGSYTILCTVTDTVCNTVDTATFTVQMTIGIDENELANRVNIYPNPSTGIFMVSLNMPQQQDEVGVEVLDALGRTVQKTTVVANGNTTEFTLNLTEQPTGLYMVRLHFGHAVVVKKVTKQ